MSDNCLKPFDNNPFMNYLFIGNENDKVPCDVKRNEIEDEFYKKYNLETTDKKVSDFTMNRFYTVPVRQEDSGSDLARFLYPNTAICRDSGYTCKMNSEKLKSMDRIEAYKSKEYYKIKY